MSFNLNQLPFHLIAATHFEFGRNAFVQFFTAMHFLSFRQCRRDNVVFAETATDSLAY